LHNLADAAHHVKWGRLPLDQEPPCTGGYSLLE